MINDKSNNNNNSNNNNLYKYYKQGKHYNWTHPHPTVTTEFFKETISKLNVIRWITPSVTTGWILII